MKKKYDYMIKTLDKNFCGYGGFQYPQKKGALVEAPDWDPAPKCGGGIHGTVAWTGKHYIQKNSIWVVLKFVHKEAVVIDNEKVKVPRAWVVDWGTAEEMQRKWERLTGTKYQFDYAVQTAGHKSTQITGNESTQIAGNYSTQTAGYESTQIAGYKSTQTAGNESTQTAGDESTQTAGHYSTQTAGNYSTQTAGDYSAQVAGDESTQTAGGGSVSIIRGQMGFCRHKGKVLQVLTFYDFEDEEYVFLTKIITDSKKHKLTAVKENGEWVLKDEIIKEEENEN